MYGFLVLLFTPAHLTKVWLERAPSRKRHNPHLAPQPIRIPYTKNKQMSLSDEIAAAKTTMMTTWAFLLHTIAVLLINER